MYRIKKQHRSDYIPIRNQTYHVQVWGEPAPDKVPLVMVHGWMDVAASYQFVVDAFAQDHYILAPDWRGYGKSRCEGKVDNYWYPDYLADLDFLLDHYVGDTPVNLVGHSMGGNVVMLYGGVRPQRIRRLVNLEGFGLPATQPEDCVKRYGQCMDELKSLHRGELAIKTYDNVDGVARRLKKTNPRLSDDKAQWLAHHWAAERVDGQWAILGEAAHKVSNAHIYRVEEAQALYARLSMPVLAVEASDDSLTSWWRGKYTLAEYHERLKAVPNVEVAVVQDAGHMLHHDQPEVLAGLIERFIA
jgi:pimeloyl-ACP methyl ester carboxylesterase